MQKPEWDDKKLLQLFRNPSTKEEGFNAILNKYKERLYWNIRRMVVIHEDADDILQNVFIKLWKNLDAFREDSALYTWLYRISVNESITHLESLKKRRLINMDADHFSLEDKVIADEHFDVNKLEWKLQIAIQKLPPQQRIVFNFRYFDEMPYSKMSEILQVSEGSLKASYHHAAKKIEDYLLHH